VAWSDEYLGEGIIESTLVIVKLHPLRPASARGVRCRWLKENPKRIENLCSVERVPIK
jgi:hypothetical protein